MPSNAFPPVGLIASAAHLWQICKFSARRTANRGNSSDARGDSDETKVVCRVASDILGGQMFCGHTIAISRSRVVLKESVSNMFASNDDFDGSRNNRRNRKKN